MKDKLQIYVTVGIIFSLSAGLVVRKIADYFNAGTVMDITELVPILVGLFSFIYIIYLQSIISKENESIAYNVSIIGFPRSGKTTMITTLFSSIMHNKIKLNQFNPIIKGNSTIERLNENISKLDKGIPIGSTNDQTLFSFRINLESTNSFLFPSKNYKVEFGDFPGEKSKEFIYTPNKTWKHDSDFFQWVKDGDAFIFVIDIAAHTLDKSRKLYKADISKSIRAAWQNILELNSHKQKELRSYPIALVFTKTDIFDLPKQIKSNEIEKDASRSIIEQKGFATNNKLPSVKKIDSDDEKLKLFINKLKTSEKSFNSIK